VDENESYADKKCFAKFDGGGTKEVETDMPVSEQLLNLKEILKLQQDDTATASSFRVRVPRTGNT